MSSFLSRRWVFLFLTAFILSGCAEVQFLSHATKRMGSSGMDDSRYKVGNPYQIAGVWYYPTEDWDYVETGIASWYGPKFHGRDTANGEVFDMNLVSAAHRTLPMPSYVMVTNLDNGRTMEVRVNDRGPYAHGRIIDLSKRAAELLGFKKNGTARVKVELIREKSMRVARNAGRPGLQLAKNDSPIKVDKLPKASVSQERLAPPPGQATAQPAVHTAPANNYVQTASATGATSAPVTSTPLAEPAVTVAAVQPTNLYIQAGAFSQYANAYRVKAALAQIGEAKITSTIVNGTELFRVRIGPLQTVDLADAKLEKIISTGYANARVIVD